MPSEIDNIGDAIVERFAGAMQVHFEKSARQLPDTLSEDRRRQHREEFDTTRMIAVWDGEAVLSESDFQLTVCRDLSANGIAFWIDEKPSVDHAVVQFEVNGEMVFLKARIAHVDPEFASGRPAFLAGCEFMGRLDWDLKL